MKLSQAIRGQERLPRRSGVRALLRALLAVVAVAVVVSAERGLRAGLVAGVTSAVLIGAVVAGRRLEVDAVDLLTLYLAALLLIPGYYVLPGLGGVGAPANVIGLLCGVWWALDRMHGGFGTGTDDRGRRNRPNPVAISVGFYFAVSALAFIAAYGRPLTPLEDAGAGQAIVGFSSLVAVALLMLWGVRTREDLDRLLRRLMLLAAVFALVAVLQFFTDFDPVTRLPFPFLQLNGAWQSVAERSGLPRVASTALHAIEFGAVLAMLIPIALHRAWYSTPTRRRENWIVAAVLAFALPLSISRTAVLALAVALLFMFPVWSWRRRINVAVGAAVLVAFMRLVQPGLIGTIIALFTWASEDPSTQGRTEDYGEIWGYIAESPIVGRGLGTFSPSQYFFLDNMLLMALVTAGVLGVLGLLGLVVTSITSARQVYWHGRNPEARHLGAALAASLAGAFVSMLTFDALGFPVFAGLFFVLCATSGVLWECEVAPWGRRYTNPRARRPAPQ